MAGLTNPPGTPRDDAEMGTNFLNPFQSDSVRDPTVTPGGARGGKRRGRGGRGCRGGRAACRAPADPWRSPPVPEGVRPWQSIPEV